MVNWYPVRLRLAHQRSLRLALLRGFPQRPLPRPVCLLRVLGILGMSPLKRAFVRHRPEMSASQVVRVHRQDLGELAGGHRPQDTQPDDDLPQGLLPGPRTEIPNF